jgi:hypothetical protein
VEHALDRAEVIVGDLAQQRLELGLVEEEDLRVAVLARPIDLLAQVLRAPAALLTVGEDRGRGS